MCRNNCNIIEAEKKEEKEINSRLTYESNEKVNAIIVMVNRIKSYITP